MLVNVYVFPSVYLSVCLSTFCMFFCVFFCMFLLGHVSSYCVKIVMTVCWKKKNTTKLNTKHKLIHKTNERWTIASTLPIHCPVSSNLNCRRGCRQLTVTLKCEAAPFGVDTSGPSIGRRGSERGGRRGGYSTERNGLETDLTGMRIARFHVWLVIQDPDIFKSQYFKMHITPEQYLTRASFFLEMKDDPVPIYHLCWLDSVN